MMFSSIGGLFILSKAMSAIIIEGIINSPISGEASIKILNLTHDKGFLIPHSSPAWHFYLLMAMFISYALARTFLGRLSSSTFMATVRYSSASSMFNDNSQLQRQRDTVLNGFYFISMGFFSMILLEKIQWKPYGLNDYKLFVFNTTVILGIFYTRVVLLNLIGYIFNSLKLFREYLYQGLSFNKLIGIVFLPLNFAIVFTYGKLQEVVIYLSISVLLILVFLKLLRGINYSIKNNVFNFYLFLYLCALEIVPMLLLYKWFKIIV